MPPRILVCDDHNHITRLIELVLKKEGYDVHCLHDGLSAWESIQASPTDLLISDQEMPGLTGLELASRIRRHTTLSSMPIILLTACAFELQKSEAVRRLRLPHILMKPFNPRELKITVQKLLVTPDRKPVHPRDRPLAGASY